VLHESAGVVQPGAPLLELGDPGRLELVVDVLTADAVQITPGDKVAIDRWGGDPLSGHVRTVEPSAFTRISALGVEEQRVNVVINVDAPREKWLQMGDGYRVEVRIETWTGENVIVVPSSAVFRRSDRWATLVVDGGYARLRLVTIGRRSATEVQIVNGLSAGEQVIIHPSEQVTDGTRIEY
jgi:HlyD family secretion protein